MANLVNIQAGQTLSTIASQLYGNPSVFRELADEFNIDEFDPTQEITGKILEISDQLESRIKAKAEQLEGVFSLFDDKRFEEIDLSVIQSVDGLSPQQLVSWLL
jgi:hypothetical protein